MQKIHSGNLTPATLHQLAHAKQFHEDASFLVDGVAIGLIGVVASVITTSENTTNITYQLDDGSDQLEAKLWLHTDLPKPRVPTGPYVLCYFAE